MLNTNTPHNFSRLLAALKDAVATLERLDKYHNPQSAAMLGYRAIIAEIEGNQKPPVALKEVRHTRGSYYYMDGKRISRWLFERCLKLAHTLEDK